MRRFLLVILAVGLLGGYLHYARGWDWTRLYQETAGRLPFLSSASSTLPFGARGTGTHWETGTSLETSRLQGGAAVVGDRLYVVGGLDGYGRTLRSMEVYDFVEDKWTTGPLLPQALHHPAVATDGRLVYVIGGFVGLSRQPVDQAWSYDPAAREWRELPKLGDFRGAAAATYLDGKIYVMGGVTDAGVTASVEAYSPVGDKWTEMPPMAQARQDFAAFVLDGKIFAAGGRDSGADATDTVEAYDPRTNKWQKAAPMYEKRSDFAAAVQGGRAYVFGGEIPDQSVLGRVSFYEPKTNTWRPFSPDLPTARHGLAAVSWRDRIYTLAGGRRPGWSVTALNQVLFLK